MLVKWFFLAPNTLYSTPGNIVKRLLYVAHSDILCDFKVTELFVLLVENFDFCQDTCV